MTFLRREGANPYLNIFCHDSCLLLVTSFMRTKERKGAATFYALSKGRGSVPVLIYASHSSFYTSPRFVGDPATTIANMNSMDDQAPSLLRPEVGADH